MCVNGLRVHYDPDVQVGVGGANAGADALAPGQVVFLVAERDTKGLRTERIEVLHAAVGRSVSIDAAGALWLGGPEGRVVPMRSRPRIAVHAPRASTAPIGPNVPSGRRSSIGWIARR